MRRVLAPDDAADPDAEKGASAILAPLVQLDDELFFLFERRPGGPSRFAGHLCFPGGRIEPEDVSPLAAALREAEEEIGFAPSDVAVLGHLVDTRDPLGRPVSCFVGVVPEVRIPEMPASPDEVAEMILVSLTDLRRAGQGGVYKAARWPRHAYQVKDYECRLFPSAERVVQYWHLDAVGAPAEATLWGFTAGVVAQFLDRLHGWAPPVAPRIVKRWEDLLPQGIPPAAEF